MLLQPWSASVTVQVKEEQGKQLSSKSFFIPVSYSTELQALSSPILSIGWPR